MRTPLRGSIGLGLAVALGIGHAVVAEAGDLLDAKSFEDRHSGAPAVSEINGKIDFGYLHFNAETPAANIMDDGHAYAVQGALSLPLGHKFGLQIDAGVMSGDFDALIGDYSVDGRGIGAHLFWRDPGVGLLGAYAHYADYDLGNPINDEITNLRYGVEAEAYLGQVTLRGFAGMDKLDIGAFGDDHFFAGTAEVQFYATDNLVLSAGVERSFETTAFTIGVEAMADLGGISPTLYADASFSDDNRTVMAGLRFYFGSGSKSLIRRHREDDPEIGIFSNFASLGSCLNGLNPGPPVPNPEPGGLLLNGAPPPIFNQQLDGCGLTTGGGGPDPIINPPGFD